MKTIFLKKLEILNFKGLRDLTAKFKKVTFITGINETGKTSIVDAVFFLLYGKDHADKQSTEFKTYDENNEIIPHLTHFVKGYFDINGEEEVFKREIKQVWDRPHGKTEQIYIGDKLAYEINSLQEKKAEFDRYINEYIDLETFRLLSNPFYFNDALTWEQQREALVKMVGGITNDEVVDRLNDELSGEIKKAISKNDFDKYQRRIIAQMKPLKESIDQKPIQIKEAMYNMPDPFDWDKLEKEKTALQKKIAKIDGELENVLKTFEKHAKENANKLKEIGELELKIQSIKNNALADLNAEYYEEKQKFDNFEMQIRDLERQIENSNGQLEHAIINLKGLEKQRAELLTEYHKEKQCEFKPNGRQFICPVTDKPCGELKELTPEFERKFNTQKAERIAANVEKGRKIAAEIEAVKNQIKDIQIDIEMFGVNIQELNTAKDAIKLEEPVADFESDEINKLQLNIEAIRKQIDEPTKPIEIDEKKQTRVNLNSQLNIIERKLERKKDIEERQKRVDQLKEEQKTLGQQLADLEKQQDEIDFFIKHKMDILEEKVNSNFQHVKFKMYHKQKNQKDRPGCITLLKGTPWEQANTGTRIKAGVEICGVMQKYHQIATPIFVDNIESLTQELPEIDTQIIKFMAVPEQNTLKFEYE